MIDRNYWRLQVLQKLVPRLVIVNVVTTGELKQFVDLERLMDLDNFRYDPSVHRCAYLKDNRTHGRVSIFSPGKMICAGAKSFHYTKVDLEHATRKLAALGLVKFTKITVNFRTLWQQETSGNPLI
jgi:TATA-box binding protein (TBP) (component of TFIID and TFIIIB)